MKNALRKFMQNRSGATAIEYGLIASFIALALIAGAQTLGGSLNNSMTSTSNHLVNSQK